MSMKFETVDELAIRLKVAKSWIYERTRTGELPYIRCGRYIRFEPDKVDQYLRRKSESE